jgi:hypothetical protein
MLNAQQIFINGIWTFYIEQRPHGRDHPVEGRLTLFGPATSERQICERKLGTDFLLFFTTFWQEFTAFPPATALLHL